jgi:hypothetical protein
MDNFIFYEGESVNRSQMDIKRKTCDVRTWEKLISRYIFHQHWYTCPIAIPMRRNRQHRSFWLLSQSILHLRFIIWDFWKSLWEFLCQVVNRFTRQTLPTVNRKDLFMNNLYTESFCPKNTHNRTLLFGSTLLKHAHRFDCWNQPLNMRMRVCYPDCHEAGLCCYLVIHIETLLRPLQLLYFHLWPIYWLSLVPLRHVLQQIILSVD